MADLSTVIEYEKLYPVSIKLPDGSESGIKINVVSKDSKRVIDALRDFQADLWEKNASEEKTEETAREKLKLIQDHTNATLIACIDSWDWGEHNFASRLSGSGVASKEDREFLINHANSGWIVGQLAGAVNSLENFMQALQESAPNGFQET